MPDTNPYQYSESPGNDRYPNAVVFCDGRGRMEFRPERYFGWLQILGFGCLAVPVGLVVGMMIGSLVFGVPRFFTDGQNWGYLLVGAVLLLLILPAIYFMPWWGFPNALVPRIIAKFHKTPLEKNQYLCQFTTKPSRYGALRIFLESADDIGVLSLNDDHLAFEGDHTTVIIPYSCIESVRLKNSGFNRSLYLGFYLRFHLSQEVGQDFLYIQIGDRMAKTLLGSYRTTDNIRKEVEAKINPNFINN